MNITPSPEFALLLDAIAPLEPPRADTREWQRADWERTLSVAEWHRVGPVLFGHLRSGAQAPGDVLEALEQAYLANCARNLFVAASLRAVLEALAAADVGAMLLKGAALLETAYGDPALREMLDLDILVPSERLNAANAALAAIGYHRKSQDGDPGPAGHHHDPALVADTELVAVELHHHIAMEEEGSYFDIAEVWDRARHAPGPPAHLLPSPEDLLLHVCFHFTRNRLGGSYRHAGTGGALSQLCDVARLVERAPLDWNALVTAARAYHLGTRVFLALFAAREVGIAVPVRALEALRPPGFDPALGRRLVALRVLRSGPQVPVRSLRWMVAPPREALQREWDADPADSRSLARAYLRRARAQAPLAGAALKRPWSVVQDYRLNGQLLDLERRD